MPAYLNSKLLKGIMLNGNTIYEADPGVTFIKSITLFISNGNGNPCTNTIGDSEVNSDTGIQLSDGTISSLSDLKTKIISNFKAGSGKTISVDDFFTLVQKNHVDKLLWAWSGGFIPKSNLGDDGAVSSGTNLSVGRATLTRAMLNNSIQTGAYVGTVNFFNGEYNKGGSGADLKLVYSLDKSANINASDGTSYKDIFG